MRIAYIAQSYPPMISGAAIVVESLAQAMVARGHEVLVLAASDRGPMYRTDAQRLSVVRLQSLHNPFRVRQRFLLCPGHSMMKRLHAFKPEIIHVHEPLQLGWLSLKYAKRAGIPVVLSLHQTPAIVASYLPKLLRPPANAVLWMYARWFGRKFSSVITPTQTTSRLFARMTDVPADTISSGVDLQTFHPALPGRNGTVTRQMWNLPLSAPLLLHVGRLDLEKQVERVIQASARMLRQTGAHLVLVGDGSQKEMLLHLCQELDITDRVHFAGFVPVPAGLPELYRTASLFVTASEIETQGIVLLEAAASGLPLVAVRATCIPEIVHDEVNGFLVEPGDISGMAHAMTLLLKDSSLAERLGRASRSLAEDHRKQSTLDAHEALYREIVRGKQICRVSWSAIDVKM